MIACAGSDMKKTKTEIHAQKPRMLLKFLPKNVPFCRLYFSASLGEKMRKI